LLRPELLLSRCGIATHLAKPQPEVRFGIAIGRGEAI
jgi:hypothetical protein